MYFSKGEAIRTILIFGSFVLWLLSLKFRENLHILKHPLFAVSLVFILSILLSSLFSMDPMYSLNRLKGEPLKFAVLFPMMATVLSDETKLRRAIYAMLFTMIFIVAMGYFSYIYYDTPLLRLNTPVIRGWHNKFAIYVNTFLPFSFILYSLWKRKWLKIILSVTMFFSILALILSTSRGGLLAFLSMTFLWTGYLAKIRGYSAKKVMAYVFVVVLLVGVISSFSFPHLRERIGNIQKDLTTFNFRTQVWGPAMEAFQQRPLLGWGYGKQIYYQEEPYRKTSYKKPPPFKPHNTFLRVMFHQGIIGLLSYMAVLFGALYFFAKEAGKATGLRAYVLVACISVLVGNYLIHSMLEDFYLQYLAVILGLGMAAKTVAYENRNH